MTDSRSTGSISGSPNDRSPADDPGRVGEDRDRSRWAELAEILVAVAVIALGVVVLIETRDIRVTPAVARVGPRVIPTIVGSGLVVIGIWYAVASLLGDRPAPGVDSDDADASLPADWITVGLLGGALAVYALLIEPAGFIIASAALFVLSALALGSRMIVRDVALGAVLAVAVFLVFDNGLGVRLPEGWLAGLF